MRKLILLLMIWVSVAGADGAYDGWTNPLTSMGGIYYSLLLSDATPAANDYPDIPEYLSTIGYFEMTSFTAGGIITNNAGSGTETLTNGASASAFTSEAETNGVSAYGSNDGSDKMDGTRFSALEGASKATFSVWLKPNSTVAINDTILSKFTSASDTIRIYVSDPATGLVFSPSDTSAGTGFTTNATHVTGVYGHHVWVFDGTQTNNATRLKYYFNGVEEVLRYTGTIPTTLATTTTGLQVGAGAGTYYDGDIDTLAIWTDALSSNEVYTMSWAQRYNNPNNGLAIGEAGEVQINPGKGWTQTDYNNRNGWFQDLVLYSSVDGYVLDATGDVIADLSGNGKHGLGSAGNVLQAGTTDNGIAWMNSSSDAFVYPTILDGATQCTVSAWIKITQLNDLQSIFGETGDSTHGFRVTLGNASLGGNDDILFVSRNGSNLNTHSTDNIVTTGVWHHVVCIQDNVDLRLYWDNTQITLQTNNPPVNPTINTLGGNFEWGTITGGGATVYQYTDMLRITLDVATDATIQDWYSEGTNYIANGDLP